MTFRFMRTFCLSLSLFLGLFTLNAQECSITDLIVEAHECDENGQVLVNIAFNYDNVGNEGFSVVGNGANYGTFEYGAEFYTIGPIEGNGNVYEFIVIDNQNESCGSEVILEAPNCEGGGDCQLSNLQFEVGDCNGDGGYNLWLTFEYSNVTQEFFDVIYQGNIIGFYSLGNLPILIENFQDNGEEVPVITVCINDNPNCCVINEFEAPNCNTNECNIWDVIAEAHECDEEGQVLVDIAFNYSNVGNEGFSIVGNGTNYGSFEYGQDFYTIGPIAGNGADYEFIIVDNVTEACNGFTFINAPNCNSEECEIFGLEYATSECDDNGNYNLIIDFQVQNPGNDFFELYYNGFLYGFYEIESLPVIIENFEDNGEPFPALAICINDVDGCCIEFEIQSPGCNSNECAIWDVFAEVYDCDDNGQFLVDIGFNYQNVGNEGFSIIGNGNNYGTFEYGQDFYTLGPLEGNGSIYEFVIIDNQSEACSNFTVIEAPNCGNGDCSISGIELEVGDCNEEGNYDLWLNFEYENPTNDLFEIIYNDEVIGSYPLAELPILIENFEDNGEIVPFFFICINDNPDCCFAYEFVAPDCNNENCEIWDVIAEAHECDENGQFLLDIAFNFQNVGNEGFSILGNGANYGTFEYGQDFYTIGPLEGNGTVYEFGIFDNQVDGCFSFTEILAPNCNGEDCQIVEIVVDPLECNGDGTFGLFINFEVINPTNEFVDIYAGDEFLGFYNIGELPLIIEAFPPSGNEYEVLTICMNDNEACCSTIEFETLNCGGENLVWPGDANSDNIANNFDVLNLGLGFEFEGQERVLQGNEWTGVEAVDWENFFEDEVNFKHADSDGNGQIHFSDLEAINLNYNLVHGIVEPYEMAEGDDNDPELFVDMPAPESINFGEPFTAPIILGTDEIPAEDVYGLAFTLNFDPDIINPTSVEISFEPSWLGVNEVNLISFDKSFAEDGQIDVAITRIDQNSVSGFGEIAAFIGVIDNVAGKEEVGIEITRVKAITNNEVIIPLRTPTEIIEVVTSTSNLLRNNEITIYPNPAKNQFNISNKLNEPIEQVVIKSINGQFMNVQQPAGSEIYVNDLPNGVYLLEIQIGQRKFLEKLIITK